MNRIVKKNKDLARRKLRVRGKVKGTASTPRLSVCRTLRHIHAQLIDDVAGKSLVSVSSQCDSLKGKYCGNAGAAAEVGKLIAEKAKEQSITTVVFDRGGKQYQGRIKALADAAREAGLKF